MERIVTQPQLQALLPDLTRRMAQQVGPDAAARLLLWRERVEIYVPEHVTPDHPIVYQLGLAAAQWLSKEMGGRYVRIPLATAALRALRDQQIRDEHDAGVPARQLALRFHLSERHVWRILGNSSLPPFRCSRRSPG